MGFDSEHWDELQALFQLAEGTPETDREKVLEAASSDPQVWKRALEILNASSAQRVVTNQTPATQNIGPYKVIRTLGSGGTGTVYLAERVAGSSIRRVAVKVLAPHAAGRGFIERFDREQRILASLEHPNIVRMEDAGITEAGQPYLVMEYIDGIHLDQYCDREKSSVDERLKLFLAVCDGVEYAHRSLVVHLDLKPSNLLVTNNGAVKLLDFGTSKLLQLDGRLTATVMATPAYASPEQLRNEPVTTACDVYSLGVVLFELLTGRRPETPNWMDETVRWREPENPALAVTGAAADRRGITENRLRSQLAGDLSTMIRKCLMPVPEERYASVVALSEDLKRYMTGRPVLARPQTTLYQMSRFVRRNRGKVSVALLLAFALIGSLFYAWQGQRRGLMEAQRAVRMQDFMYNLFKTANANAIGKANPSLKDFLQYGAGLMPQYLHDPEDLRQAQLSFAQSMHRNEDNEPARQLLNTVVTSAKVSGDVAAEAEARGTLGMIAFNQGRKTEALEQASSALELSKNPAVPTSRRFFIVQQYALINSDLRGASPETQEILASGIREARQNNLAPSDIAEALNFLGAGYVNIAKLDEAGKAYSEALRLDDQVDPSDQCAHALVWSGLAGVRRAQNHPQEAADLLRRAYDGRLKCFGDGPYTRIQLSYLGDALVAMGQTVEGLSLLEKEAPGWRVPGINPSLAFQHLKFLGSAYVASGQFREGDQAMSEAFQLFGKNLPPTSKRLAALQLDWARALLGMGRYREALPHAESAVRLFSGRPSEPLARTNLAAAQKLATDARERLGSPPK